MSKTLEQKIKTIFRHLNNKQLVDRINDRYANGLNDDDEIYELVRRRKLSGKQIAMVNGEYFIMVKESENK